MKRELEVARALAREAGALVMRLRTAPLDVELKPGDEPVTIADRAANELIVRELTRQFIDDAIISEELPPTPNATGAHRLWLVDPIDGTKDFIRGGDGFSVMIGLAVAGRPCLGVVYQPSIDRMFFATPDGAFVEAAGTCTPLTVSSVAAASGARLVASASHRSDDIDEVKSKLGIHDEHNVGSVGVKLGLIALGLRDLYVNPWPKTKAWDTCAPEAILTQAGGRLSTLFGEPIVYGQALGHPQGLVASNGHIHDEVVAKISPLFAALRDAT